MGLRQWLGFETVPLVSPLSLATCIDRLRMVAQSEWAIFGTSAVVGRVGERSLRLRKRLKLTHNSFQTYLFAKLSSDGETTRLSCRFGPHPFVIVFMLFWLGSVTIGALTTLVVGLQQAAAGTTPSFGLGVPWIMVVFGIVLVFVGRTMARGERQFLLDFLRETIDARPVRGAAEIASVVQR